MNKINTLIITKDKIYTWVKDEKKFGAIETWDKESLLSKIQQIKIKHGINKAQILLSDDLCFVLSFTIENINDADDRHQKIARKVAERIPEDFNSIAWDYKLGTIKDKTIVQVAAIEKDLIIKIQQSFSDADIKIDLIEPLSCAIAKLVNNEDKNKLILFTSELGSVILLSCKSIVIVAQSIFSSDFYDSFNKFHQYIKNKYIEYEPKSIVINDDLNLIDERVSEMISLENLSIEKFDAILQKLSGEEIIEPTTKDEGRLDLIESDVPEKKQKKRLKIRTLVMISVIILMLVISSLAITSYLKGKNNQPASQVSISTQTKIEDKPKEEVKEEVKVEAEPEKVKFSDFKGYKLKILNGSGIKGEADKLKLALSPLNFDDVQTGNADTYNYTKTIISYKTPELLNNFELFDSYMKVYEVEHSDKLVDVKEEADIIIIIGKDRIKEDLGVGTTESPIQIQESFGISPL